MDIETAALVPVVTNDAAYFAAGRVEPVYAVDILPEGVNGVGLREQKLLFESFNAGRKIIGHRKFHNQFCPTINPIPLRTR